MKKNSLLIITLFAAMINVYAQAYDPLVNLLILKHYDENHLHRIALPIGGIGTGTVSLGGNGALRDWEIMNVPAKNYSTVTTGNDAPFFAIFTKAKNEKPKTKALLGPIDDADYQHYEGRSVDHHGLPRFRKATFDTSYPFGIVNLSDDGMPIKVKMIGYNPLIPGDSDASGIPIAILKYEVENTSQKDLEVAISGNIRNFIGKDGSQSKTDWKGDFIPIGAKKNVNKYRETNNIEGIYMYSEGVSNDAPAWGTMALTIPKGENQKVSYRTSSTYNDWGNALLDFWDDFSEDGVLTEKKEQVDPDPMASLAVQKSLKPGEKKVFTFYLTWHFPNRQSWGSWSITPQTKVGNYYTTRYSDAWDVIEKEKNKIPSLTEKTITFVNALINSSYPDVVKEAALFNVSTLRSQTVFRTEDGKMFGWEGVMDRFGSCFGSCTHVWNYEQATAFLFNDLARTMREVEFEYATKPSGQMSFRVELPLNKDVKAGVSAADGQMGTIMKFYREWQLSGDTEFLKKHWKKVKAALAFSWETGGWDANVDGVMEGVQHNTMDVEYYGANPQMQLWYLGALKAGGKMAKAMGDKKFSKKCLQLFEKGSKWTDEHLFNGEYYIHKIETPKHKEDINPLLMAGMGSKDINNPDYQLAQGCLVDQLVGQYMAHVLGLGYLVKKENVATTLRSILKYNKREDMFSHFNNMRSYTLGDETSLLMASWPKGGRPKVPFPYYAETMTGFEYTAAIGMLYEGMEKEGLEVIKNIRDRYNGKKRNPFDEAECGHHYARAMASWATILVGSGFHYSGVDQSIAFTNKAGNYFWSNGSAWGTCVIRDVSGKKQIEFSVLSGSIILKTFKLSGEKIQSFKTPQKITEDKKLNIII